jgi:hypothetical protein
MRFNGNSVLLAATNPDSTYTDIVAESDYLEDFHYNWNYTLKRWIEYENSITGNTANSESSQRPSKNKTINHKPLKCRFCKLKFENRNLRGQHERSWHHKNGYP